MKNYKKLFGAAALASAVVMSCFTFAGCGEDGKGDKGGNTDVNAQYHEGKVEDDLPDMSKVVSEKVADEAAWKAAFNYDGCENISAYLVHELSENNKVNDAIYSWVKIDGNKQYNYSKYIKENVVNEQLESGYGEAYCVGEGEDARVYAYDGRDTYWHKYPAKADYLIHEFFDFIEYPYDGMSEVGFADIKYENGAYRYTYESEDGSYVKYVCKIANGKVVYAKNEYKLLSEEIVDSGYNGRTDERYFYNIGTTKISLPTKTKEEAVMPEVKGEKVTSEQWGKAVAKSEFDNAAMNVISSRYKSSNKLHSRRCEMHKFDFANGVYSEFVISGDSPSYNVMTDSKHGGKIYGSSDNKKWTVEGDDYNLFGFFFSLPFYNYIKLVEGKFDTFTFNDETGEYVAENVTLNSYYGQDLYEEQEYSKVTVTFKDGKLVKVCTLEKDGSSSDETVCYISDYGVVKIDVPKVK